MHLLPMFCQSNFVRMTKLLFLSFLLSFFLSPYCLQLSSVAHAADLIHQYDFNDNLNDTLPTAIPLTTHPNTATSGYGSSEWWWTAGTSPGGGLVLETTLLADPQSYSLRFSIKYNEVSSYRKIVSFKGTGDDNGFYFLNGNIVFYPLGANNAISYNTNTFYDFIFSRGVDDVIRVYVVEGDGTVTKVYEVSDSNDSSVPVLVDGKYQFMFFMDDTATSSEWTTGGSVRSIRVWNGPLTEEEVNHPLSDAITGDITDNASGSATLNGTVNPNGSSAIVTFEYGLTVTYGTEVAADQSPLSGTTSVAVSKSISGLVANTPYHYRIKAVNAAGTSYGADVSFTTIGSEINLKQGTTDIADGGSHDFGIQTNGTDTNLVFTIENTGTADLILSGSPVIVITGTDADQFSVQASQPTSPVTGGSSTTFTVRFSPTSTGAKTAAIAIASNDSDENPYDLTITGTGTTAGVTIDTLSSTTTDENGAAATFTVVLDSEPTANVVIPLSSSDTSEGTVSSASLTFTSANWDTAQTVTVIGVNDDLFDGNIAYIVEIGPAVSADSDYSGIDPADKDLTNNDNNIDSDGDGISDALEGSGDYDGDGIINSQDYDPTGYLYDSATGEIIIGGSISVSGPGSVNFIGGRNGSNGYYQFIVDQTGTYTITVTPPAGYSVNSTGCADSGTLTVNSTPNPHFIGSGEDGSTGYLADYSCGNNEWYLTINIQATTPLILNNNIPLEASPGAAPTPQIPTLNEWGMIITSCLLALAALTVLRRREKM